MTIEIFWFSGSGYAWRAQLAAELKGITYESRLIQASNGDHRTPEFVAMNPRSKVPVLRVGDLVVTESLAILAYLDRRFPQPPLFGRTPEETARIWRAVLDFDNYAAIHFTNLVMPLFLDEVAANRDQVDAAAGAVRSELSKLEQQLKSSPWIAGDALSAADIAVNPFVEGVLRGAAKPAAQDLDLRVLPLTKTFPKLGAWRERIRALPCYEAAYLPHWRDAA